MKIFKNAILYLLFLIAMILCATSIMKVLDIIFRLDYENIWAIGYKVGFTAWLVLSATSFFSKTKKGDTKENSEKTRE